MGRALSCGLAIGLACSCGSPPPPAPSAVIAVSPAAICQDDAFTTPIELDASGSSPKLTLVYVRPDPNEPPLSFHWSFEGSAIQIDDGDSESPQVTLRAAGDRPLHVSLRVRNAEGGETVALTTIGITLRDPNGACPMPPP